MRVVFAHKKWENDLLLWCFFPHITYVHFWQSILKSVWPFQQHYPPWVVAWQINQHKFYFLRYSNNCASYWFHQNLIFFWFSTRFDRLFEWHHCLKFSFQIPLPSTEANAIPRFSVFVFYYHPIVYFNIIQLCVCILISSNCVF